MHILVTGGAGYIGSHTCLELLNKGFEVSVIDDFSNSSQEAVKRVEEITGKPLPLYEINLCDKPAVSQVFADNGFDAVIHFAGFKAVGESVAKPLMYYRNNLDSTLTLCEVMEEHGVRQLVFSSSATVYGLTEVVPNTEDLPLGAINPYGHTKVMIEQILRDLAAASTRNGWQISALRYYNPIGAHTSGRIGEDPNDIPNNLLPFITQVAIGKLPKLKVFGDDYDTPDGTGVRDYIHVVDLALGHIAALEHLPAANSYEAYNLGTGKGTSVLEMVKAVEAASGKPVPYDIVDRRPGDIAVSLADPAKANRELQWQATQSVQTACADAWRWQSQNPDGYR